MANSAKIVNTGGQLAERPHLHGRQAGKSHRWKNTLLVFG
jgi:hypothetical protein